MLRLRLRTALRHAGILFRKGSWPVLPAPLLWLAATGAGSVAAQTSTPASMPPATATATATATAQTQTPTRPTALRLESGTFATDNAAFAVDGARRADVAAWVRPSLAWQHRGAGFQADVQAAASFLGYARGTEGRSVQPEVLASFKANLIERWLTLDASGGLRSSQADFYGPGGDEFSSVNRRTERAFQVSPALEHALSADTVLLARHQASSTANGADDGAQIRIGRSLVRIERAPLPFGASLQWSSDRSSTDGFAASRLVVDSVRGAVNVSVANEWLLGLAAGTERSRFLLSDQSDPYYGVCLDWNPGPRTSVSARAERRFFGNAGSLRVNHRTPLLAFSLNVSREPVTVTDSVGVLSPGADLRASLDSILTTRYPDPTVRGVMVDKLVADLGVATRVPVPVDLAAAYPQLQTLMRASLSLLDRRNVLSLTGYSLTSRQLAPPGDALAAALLRPVDSRQWNLSGQMERMLSEQMSLGMLIRRTRAQGLGMRAGDSSAQLVWRVWLQRRLSAHADLVAGLQMNRFKEEVGAAQSVRASTVFLGLQQRF